MSMIKGIRSRFLGLVFLPLLLAAGLAFAWTISSDSREEGHLTVTAKTISIPQSISTKAQQALRAGYQKPLSEFSNKFPLHTDKEEWRRVNAELNTRYEKSAESMLKLLPVAVKTKVIDGVITYIAIPNVPAAKSGGHIVLQIHGGAFVRMGGKSAMILAAYTATQIGCTVFSVDYSMPPDFPFPRGLNDIVSVYQELLKTFNSKDIVIYGLSAGGNLAAAAVLKIRDQGLPQPGTVVLLSPEVDLTESGDSFQTLLGWDPVIRGSLSEANLLYADGKNLRDPYLSPLFADFTKGFPPTFIQAGTRDVFLSNSVRLHRVLRRAHINAELHIWEGMPHGGFGTAPEDNEVLEEIKEFIKRHQSV